MLCFPMATPQNHWYSVVALLAREPVMGPAIAPTREAPEGSRDLCVGAREPLGHPRWTARGGWMRPGQQ